MKSSHQFLDMILFYILINTLDQYLDEDFFSFLILITLKFES